MSATVVPERVGRPQAVDQWVLGLVSGWAWLLNPGCYDDAEGAIQTQCNTHSKIPQVSILLDNI